MISYLDDFYFFDHCVLSSINFFEERVTILIYKQYVEVFVHSHSLSCLSSNPFWRVEIDPVSLDHAEKMGWNKN